MICPHVLSNLEISGRVRKKFCSIMIGLVLKIIFVALKMSRVKCVAVSFCGMNHFNMVLSQGILHTQQVLWTSHPPKSLK